MQNRYEGRQRHSGDFRQEDDINWNDRDRGRDESRSWAGDRDRQRADTQRPYGGQYARDDDARAYSDRGDWRARSSQDQYGYGAQRYEPTRGYDSGETWGRGEGRFERQPRSGEFGRDYGVNRAYGSFDSREEQAARAYRATSHAPGSQIWEGSGPDVGRRDFEPDYLHWREQQMSKFDRDYDDWRSERRQKFSSDFDTWRSQRDNPQVDNVSDGGVGSQKDVKKA